MQVGWLPLIFYKGNYTHDMDLLYMEPERLTAQTNGTLTECPAHTQFLSNFFVIRAPMDLEVWYRKEDHGVASPTLNEDQFGRFINVRHTDIGDDELMHITIRWPYLFVADEDCELETYPAFYHGSPFNISVGSFNIHKWQRPVDLTFLVTEDVKINIRRGDPLFYVRFNHKDRSTKLKRLEWNEDIKRCLDQCNLKGIQRNLSWRIIETVGNWRRPRKLIK